MDLHQLNATACSLARMRRRRDLALRYVAGPCGNPHWLRPKGVLLLRRWPTTIGGKHQPPLVPTCVGFAVRPTTSVSNFAGAAYAADTIYWHRVDKVSAGGICAHTPPDQAQVAVWGGAGHIGAIPNSPGHVRALPLPGPKVNLTWTYNRLGEQAAPGSFDVFSDGGTGTMDWTTPVANVTYAAGQEWFSWVSGVLAIGPRLFNVRAKTAGGVYSLVPRVADKVLGTDTNYSPTGGQNGVYVRLLDTPATPAAPTMG